MLTYDFSKRGTLGLYEYLYECLKADILEGKLSAGEKLPSKRAFARHLQMSIKTVENAYEQLLMEGYITAKEKSGYYVALLEGEDKNVRAKAGFSDFAPGLLDTGKRKAALDIRYRVAAFSDFPYSTWAKMVREVLSYKEVAIVGDSPWQGVYELREQIARYLYAYRGMQVSSECIVVGSNMDELYGRLIALLGRDAHYAFEDPGYGRFAKICDTQGLSYDYVRIDEDGMEVDRLSDTMANVAVVSPAHHFPTGLVMPIGRRLSLLTWAEKERGRYIIENDFDSEFRFSKRPIPTIYSMEYNHRVIYMNSFMKTMMPTIPISYMVLPRKLMEQYEKMFADSECRVSVLEQHALAEFMEKGYFERHIQRMKKHYKGKRDAFLQVLKDSPLLDITRIEEKDAGNHFLMGIDTNLSDTQIKWFARENGVDLELVSEYCVADKQRYAHQVIVSYTTASEKDFEAAVEKITQLFM